MSTPTVTPRRLPSYIVDELKYSLTDVGLSLFFYGIQVALFIGAVVAIFRKEGRIWILAVSIITVFLCPSTQAASSITNYWLQMPGVGGGHGDESTTALDAIAILSEASYHISYLLGDALVVWRAWVIWSESKLICGSLTYLIRGLIGGLSFDLVVDLKSWLDDKALNAPMIIAMLLTNAVATALVGVRVWTYRRDIAAALGLVTFGSRVGGLLMLLLESGILYCAIWVTIFVLEVGVGSMTWSTNILVSGVLHLFATAYPTLVILLVTTQQHLTVKSMMANQSSFLPSIQFVVEDTPSRSLQG
ncbi:hypothetical protein K525DRAFT_206949 [Schizophyllum commune Loenen D]|nr:hypothetical protein K525DRAFT_206949 [Schizophyllum commune Loenen D]